MNIPKLIEHHRHQITLLESYLENEKKKPDVSIQKPITVDDSVEREPDVDSVFTQDVIWDRRVQAHKMMSEIDHTKNHVINENYTPVPLPTPNTEDNHTEKKYKPEKHVEINKLHQFPKKKQNQILKKIYKKAVLNISRMNDISPIQPEEYEERVQAEADELLEKYLNKN